MPEPEENTAWDEDLVDREEVCVAFAAALVEPAPSDIVAIDALPLTVRAVLENAIRAALARAPRASSGVSRIEA